MTVLMRASEIAKRPVVTYAGEDVAQVKDIVYGAGGGQVGGFTLNGRGFLSSPLKTSLPWRSVAALGQDAVMITSEDVLVETATMLADTGASEKGNGGNILGSRVLTDDGTDLGKVIDVILQVGDDPATEQADVVGYEIEPSEALGKDVKKAFVPLPDTMAASGENLIVPAGARQFIGHDLAGFGASVEAFRAQLGGTT